MGTVRTSYPWDRLLETGRGEQLVTTAREGARRGSPTPIPDDLHPALLDSLRDAEIATLWSHQADMLDAARRGHAIVTRVRNNEFHLS